jgi:CRP-like cAMP-binding protein
LFAQLFRRKSIPSSSVFWALMTESCFVLPPFWQENAMVLAPRSYNHFLSSLSEDDFELLRPHLRETQMVHQTTLVKTDEVMNRAYFPFSGVISLVIALVGGEMVEVAMIGRDSVLGASAALDGRTSLNEAIVQIPGNAATLDISLLSRAASDSASLRAMLSHHAEFVYAQAQQAAACNASHTLNARLARWLLRVKDLTGSNTMPLTQEFLSQMLGVQRSSVSLTANTLQEAGLISYRRGHIEIKNLVGLIESSCECYDTLRRRGRNLLGFPSL